MTDVVTLDMPETGIRIDSWSSYSFNSNFLTPTDEWQFTIESEALPATTLRKLAGGRRVTLAINGHVQGDGYIDDVSVSNGRDVGTTITLEGRDRLAQMVDTNMDPRIKFPASQTLEQFILQIAAPFGWSSESQVTDSNAANRNVLTGQTRGVSKSVKGRYIKSVLTHQLKPYPHEGTFSFLSRITQRHGLWTWLSADGTQLVVGKPSFDQRSSGSLIRRVGNSTANNVLRGSSRSSLRSQPSIIVAQGRGGGGEFPKSRLTVLIENPAVAADNRAIFAAYPDAKVVHLLDDSGANVTAARFTPLASAVSRPMFLEDDEAKTPDELENFVRRELALKIRQHFTAHYVVDGHTMNGVPWAVDTMVDVDDDRLGIHEPLYVLSRTFTKSRSDGTKTQLELIKPHSLIF